METKFVVYNGVNVVEGWPEKIQEAQRKPTVFINGKEKGYKSAEVRPCHDCAVIKGQLHVPDCDMERCPACGGQAVDCECRENLH